MTNYNERLDKLMPCDCKFLKGFAWRKGDPCEGCINGRLKQAITSLIKELVAEAKPERQPPMKMGNPTKESSDLDKMIFAKKKGHNEAIDQFEQNLLKELEDK